MENKPEEGKGGSTPFPYIHGVLWQFAMAIPSLIDLKTTIKAVELAVSQPPSFVKTAPRLAPSSMNRLLNPPLPLFPQIGGVSGPFVLATLPLPLQPVVVGFFGLLPFLTVGSIVATLVCLSLATFEDETTESPPPEREPARSVPLPDKSKGGELIYIKTQGGFLPWLMYTGSHVVCNCDLPDLNLRALQVGRITQLCENPWIKISFNNKTGPWLDLEGRALNSDVGAPFTLLHASRNLCVDLNGVGPEPKVFDIHSNWTPPKGQEFTK